jgi:hypothetical protein
MDNSEATNMNAILDVLMGQNSVNDPLKYAGIIRATKSARIADYRKQVPVLRETLEKFEQSAKKIQDLRKHLDGDGFAKRRKSSKGAFDSLEVQSGAPKQYIDIATLIYEFYIGMVEIYKDVYMGMEMVTSANIIALDKAQDVFNSSLQEAVEQLGQDRVTALSNKITNVSADAFNSLIMEQQMNRGATTAFITGLDVLSKVPARYVSFIRKMAAYYESYYERLRHRHSQEGLKIAKVSDTSSVSVTDIALLVWENIDRVGEIQDGCNKDEVSVYTLHKANAMIEALKADDVWAWVTAPDYLMKNATEDILPMITDVKEFAVSMKKEMGEVPWRLISLNIESNQKEFESVLEGLNLDQIREKDPERSISKTERFSIDYQNKSIQKVADLLSYGAGLGEIVGEILKLKVEEHKFFTLENSFYVCKIGTGNMFSGEAPGQLEIIPGEKPTVDLKHIWGEGFDDVRDFIHGAEEARRWQPLFLSTSPSKSTDKNNVLLVGPMGCGKTELLRGLSCDKESIAIFAIGSDFLTCWLGEAQKNPKRLFDAAIKLHKSTGRQVHILIDEIDMVLSEDRSNTKVNLSLEFQNIMDGVVAYPGVSIWGATNHPEKIPTPMLRRFARVMVVGELSKDDRTSILKHYLEHYLPCEDFSQSYGDWADRLDGATGDLIRKAVDEVWKDYVRGFIKTHKDEAESILKLLNEKHGGKFEVSSVTDEDREDIRKYFGDTTKVTVEMVTAHIEKLLNNFAIQQQIQVAKDTYRNAKKLLKEQKRAESASVGF